MYNQIYRRGRFTAGIAVILTNVIFAQVQPRIPANFTLQVNGQVRYAGSHQPAERVLVRIESFSGGLVGQSTTDRGGKFSFTGLTPMQYIVTVHAPGYLDIRESVDLLTSNSGYLNVELMPDTNGVGSDKPPNAPDLVRVIDANIPTEAQSHYAKGQALLYGDGASAAANAAKELEKAVAIYPKYLQAQILLGLAYLDVQKWDKAEKPLLAAIELDPRASTAYFALGEAYFWEKKYSEGEKVLLDAFKINPDAAQGHFTLARIYWEKAPRGTDEQQFRRDAESAWKEVSKAIQLDPTLAEAHLLAGNMLLRARRGADALSHFEQYLKLSPNGKFAEETTALVKKLKDSLAQTGKNDE